MNVDTFEDHRRALHALAYRMLGDVGAAEEIVQETWIRAQDSEVRHPTAWLHRVTTRLCLDRLRRVREEPVVRLPEPVFTDDSVERADSVSLAFLVLLQELSPAERAALLLCDVFGLPHAEVALAIDRSEAACRQLLRRARQHARAQRSRFEPSAEAHRALLHAFAAACRDGNLDQLTALLAEDVRMVADGGPDRARFGALRALRRPLEGRHAVARFAMAAMSQGLGVAVEEAMVNGLPAMLVRQDDVLVAVVQVAGRGRTVHRVFIQADPARLRRLGERRSGV